MKTIRFEGGITLDNDAVGTFVDGVQHVIEKAITRGNRRISPAALPL